MEFFFVGGGGRDYGGSESMKSGIYLIYQISYSRSHLMTLIMGVKFESFSMYTFRIIDINEKVLSKILSKKGAIISIIFKLVLWNLAYRGT